MKRTTKKILALLLTVVMTLPMLVVGTNADATPAPALPDEVFLDFSDASQLTTYLGGKTDGGTVVPEVKDGVLQYAPAANGNKYLLTMNNLVDTKYFSIRFDFKVSAAVADTGYFGFVFRPFAMAKDTDQSPMHNYSGKLNFHHNSSYTQLTPNAWYNYEVSRDAEVIHYTLRDANGAIIGSHWTDILEANLSLTSSPCIRLMCGTGTSIVMSIDNMTLKNTTPDPDVVVEDFDGMKAETLVTAPGSMNVARQLGALKYYSTTGDFVGKIVEEDGNKYLNVSSAAGNNTYWIYPNGFKATTNYTMTYDFKIKGTPALNDTTKYIGFNHSTNVGSGQHYISYYNCPDKTAGGAKMSGLRVANDAMFMSDFTTDTWYSVKIVRNSNNIDYYVWKKGESFTTATHGLIGAAPTTATVPGFRLMFSGTVNGEISMDNISYKTFDSSINFVGAQKSTTVAADNTYAVRFIGTVDSLDYTTVGFQIKATYTENGQTVTRTFNKTDCKVYTSITASEADNIESYTAEELGGNYLIALSIYGIPVSAGDVTFEITAVAKVPNVPSNAKVPQYTSTAKTLYADVTDNTVELKNSLG